MLLFRNTEQFKGILEQSGLVVTVVFLEPFGSKAMQARVAPVMLWT